MEKEFEFVEEENLDDQDNYYYLEHLGNQGNQEEEEEEEEEEQEEEFIDINLIDNAQDRIIYNNQEKFNKNYLITQKLDDSISNKNKLIMNTTMDNKKTNMFISALVATLTALFLAVFVMLMVFYKIFDMRNAKVMLILIAAGYLYRLFIIYNLRDREFTQLSLATAKELEEKLNGFFSQKKKCEKVQTVQTVEEEEEPPSVTDVLQYRRRVRSNSSRDYWRIGSSPDTLYTSEPPIANAPNPYTSPTDLPTYRKGSNEDIIKPKMWVKGKTQMGLIKYTCRNKGQPNPNDPFPYNEEEVTTPFPCDYYPNFEEVSKEIEIPS